MRIDNGTRCLEYHSKWSLGYATQLHKVGSDEKDCYIEGLRGQSLEVLLVVHMGILKGGVEKNFSGGFAAEDMLLQRKKPQGPTENRDGKLLMKVESSRVAHRDEAFVTVCFVDSLNEVSGPGVN